ncbi:hypothetical protein BB560_007037 [Smittium megazygosporum]|uniref:DNA-directed RNA polymerase subunit n=1 Tax=Smittium megazygosporum TaxID=133381 RepID=A0A2T9XZ75_9FUNG|nr:hypothetical protein BB560_007037 [Smittium megazygosporum]
MLFCPSCCNLLLIKPDAGAKGESCFVCQTCPYMFPIQRPLVTRTVLKRKQIDDVLGGANAWQNVDSIQSKSTWSLFKALVLFLLCLVLFSILISPFFDDFAAVCPKCEHERAYFMQIQIRSADEPMTTFYKCCQQECSHQWREN